MRTLAPRPARRLRSRWRCTRSSATRRSRATVLPRDVAREVVALFNATTTLRATERTGDRGGARGRRRRGGAERAGDVAGRVTRARAGDQRRRDPAARARASTATCSWSGARWRGARARRSAASCASIIRRCATRRRATSSWRDSTDERRGAVVAAARAARPARTSTGSRSRPRASYNRVEGLPVRIGPVLYRDQGWGHLRARRDGGPAHGEQLLVGDAGRRPRRDAARCASGRAVRRDARRAAVRRRGRRGGVAAEQRRGGARVVLLPPRLPRLLRAARRAAVRRAARDGGRRPHAVVRRRAVAGARDARPVHAVRANGVAWRENPQLDAGRFHLAERHAAHRHAERRRSTRGRAGTCSPTSSAARVRSTCAGPTSPGVRAGTATGPTRYQPRILRRAPVQPPVAERAAQPAPRARRLAERRSAAAAAPAVDRRAGHGAGLRLPQHGRARTWARAARALAPPGRPAQCERVALAQLEYRSDLRISVSRRTRRARAARRFRADGAWVFFADAGRGWLVNAPGSPLNIGRHDAAGALDVSHGHRRGARLRPASASTREGAVGAEGAAERVRPRAAPLLARASSRDARSLFAWRAPRWRWRAPAGARSGACSSSVTRRRRASTPGRR